MFERYYKIFTLSLVGTAFFCLVILSILLFSVSETNVTFYILTAIICVLSIIFLYLYGRFFQFKLLLKDIAQLLIGIDGLLFLIAILNPDANYNDPALKPAIYVTGLSLIVGFIILYFSSAYGRQKS